ncbi:MAG: hypothetical protein Q4P29_06370 [Tissierellia bacterium]|nr:hypothetical protein [Tissierellia bacterium]
MKIKEYGIENKRRLLFLPGSLSDISWYENSIELLKRDFHIFAIIYDGYHKPYNESFETVEKTVNELTEYFKEREIFEFDTVYGLSMGGGIANLLYATDEFKIKNLIMDGGITPYQLPWILTRFILLRDIIGLWLLRRSKRILKAFFPSEHWILEGEDEDEYYDEIHEYLNTISFKTMVNCFDSCNNYSMPKNFPNNETKIYYIYGELEKKERAWDIDYIKKTYPKAAFKEIKNMEHGELSTIRPREFYETICKLTK